MDSPEVQIKNNKNELLWSNFSLIFFCEKLKVYLSKSFVPVGLLDK